MLLHYDAEYVYVLSLQYSIKIMELFQFFSLFSLIHFT